MFSPRWSSRSGLPLLLLWTSLIASSLAFSDRRLTVWDESDFFGESRTFKYNEGCVDFEENWRERVSSLDVHGNCVALYDQEGCRGNVRYFMEGSPDHNDLNFKEFDDAAVSFEPCDVSIEGLCWFCYRPEAKRSPEYYFWREIFSIYSPNGKLIEFEKRLKDSKSFIRWEFVLDDPSKAARRQGDQYQDALEYHIRLIKSAENAGPKSPFNRTNVRELVYWAEVVVTTREDFTEHWTNRNWDERTYVAQKELLRIWTLLSAELKQLQNVLHLKEIEEREAQKPFFPLAQNSSAKGESNVTFPVSENRTNSTISDNQVEEPFIRPDVCIEFPFMPSKLKLYLGYSIDPECRKVLEEDRKQPIDTIESISSAQALQINGSIPQDLIDELGLNSSSLCNNTLRVVPGIGYNSACDVPSNILAYTPFLQGFVLGGAGFNLGSAVKNANSPGLVNPSAEPVIQTAEDVEENEQENRNCTMLSLLPTSWLRILANVTVLPCSLPFSNQSSIDLDNPGAQSNTSAVINFEETSDEEKFEANGNSTNCEVLLDLPLSWMRILGNRTDISCIPGNKTTEDNTADGLSTIIPAANATAEALEIIHETTGYPMKNSEPDLLPSSTTEGASGSLTEVSELAFGSIDSFLDKIWPNSTTRTTTEASKEIIGSRKNVSTTASKTDISTTNNNNTRNATKPHINGLNASTKAPFNSTVHLPTRFGATGSINNRTNQFGPGAVKNKKKRPGCGISFLSGSDRVESLLSFGLKTEPGQFPWHVGIYFGPNFTYICGGTLLSQYVVLTAAHCLHNPSTDEPFDKTEIRLILGKYYRDYDVKGLHENRANVKEIVINDDYKGRLQSYANDVAILELDCEPELTSYISPICVDWRGIEDLTGKIGTVAGWGLDENDEDSSMLFSARLSYYDRDVCLQNASPDFKPFISQDKFCAGLNNQTYLRKGDSGGGLSFLRHGREYIYGVVSIRPIAVTTYVAYTDMRYHKNWLQSVTRDLEKRRSPLKMCENTKSAYKLPTTLKKTSTSSTPLQ